MTFVLAVVLIGGGLVTAFGASAGSVGLGLHDTGAWLASGVERLITHVNGPSGVADDKIGLAGGHKLTINQDGVSVLVTDENGYTVRIDPGQLTVATHNTFGADTFLIAQGIATYVVDKDSGTITRIDPYSLAPLGAPVSLGGPVSGAGFAADGTAWFALPRKGTLVPIRNGRRGPPLRVAEPGADSGLQLTIAGGVPVAVDASAGRLTPIRSAHGSSPVHLGTPVDLPASARGATLKVAASNDGSVIPIAVASSSELLLVDIDARTVRVVSLGSQGPSGSLGPPVINGGRIYIPDNGKGDVLVYNAKGGSFGPKISLPGGGGELTAFVRNGAVWINNPETSQAKVVTANGDQKPINKYDPNIPQAPSKTTKNAAPRIITVPVTKYQRPTTTTPSHQGVAVKPPPITQPSVGSPTYPSGSPPDTSSPPPVVDAPPTIPTPIDTSPAPVAAPAVPVVAVSRHSPQAPNSGWADVTVSKSTMGGQVTSVELTVTPQPNADEPITGSGSPTWQIDFDSCIYHTFVVTAIGPGGHTSSPPITDSECVCYKGNPPVMTIGPPTLPQATVGAPYDVQLLINGEVNSNSWYVMAGTLPDGLAVSDRLNGIISGAPTAAGTFSFTIHFNTSGACGQQTMRNYTMTVVG